MDNEAPRAPKRYAAHAKTGKARNPMGACDDDTAKTSVNSTAPTSSTIAANASVSATDARRGNGGAAVNQVMRSGATTSAPLTSPSHQVPHTSLYDAGSTNPPTAKTAAPS